MSYIANALRGCSTAEVIVIGAFGFAIFIGVITIVADLIDIFSGR